MPYDDSEGRSALTNCICVLGGITLVVSIVAIAIGIFSISVTQAQWEFPFTAGGAMVAGISALLLSCCPILMYNEDKKSHGSHTSGCFDCLTILMVVWWSITILAILFAFGLAGIYGVVSCSNEELKLKACSNAAEKKMAISIVTIILTLILLILSLAIFFTCCCNSATFGVPLMASDDRFHGFGTSYRSGNDTFYGIERVPSYIERRRENQRLAIRETSAEARMNRFRSLADDRNDNNTRAAREPSAPNIGDFRSSSSGIYVIEETSPTSSERVDNRFDDPPPSYEELPPSYDEVIAKDHTTVTAV